MSDLVTGCLLRVHGHDHYYRTDALPHKAAKSRYMKVILSHVLLGDLRHPRTPIQAEATAPAGDIGHADGEKIRELAVREMLLMG